MKRVLLTAAVALLIPSLVGAWTPTVGVYVDGYLTYTPDGPFVPFLASLVIVQNEYYVTGIEYSLVTPSDPAHGQFVITGYDYPPSYSVHLGNPWDGHAITFWPPLTGFPTGYDVCVTYECITMVECVDMFDYPIVVAPDPGSGYLRVSYGDDNDLLEVIGLTSYLCPAGIGVEEGSWGAIKSMY